MKNSRTNYNRFVIDGELQEIGENKAMGDSDSDIQIMPEEGEYNNTRVILILTIDIGNGKKESIKLREGDDPEVVSSQFCEEYDLSPDVVPILSAYIMNNINNIQKPNYTGSYRPISQISNTPSSDSLRGVLQDIHYEGNRKEKYRTCIPLSGGCQSDIDPPWKRVIQNVYTEISNKQSYAHVPSINEESKKILRTKSQGSKRKRDIVHERLYTDSISRNNSEQLSTNLTGKTTRTAKPLEEDTIWTRTACSAIYPRKHQPISYSTPVSPKLITSSEQQGIILYRQSMENRKKKLRDQYTERQKLANSRNTHSFSPEINSNYKYILRKPLQTAEEILAEEYLLQEIHKENNRMKDIEEFKKTCTFKPKLSKRTEELAINSKIRIDSCRGEHQKERSRDLVFDTLFENTQKKCQNKEKLREETLRELRFKPNISKYKNVLKAEYLKTDIVTRTLQAEKDKKDKLIEMRKKKMVESEFDPSTGRRYFTPKISRTPKRERKEKGESLEKYLVENKKMIETKAKAKERSEERWNELSKATYNMTNSSKIVRNTKLRRYKEIFNILGGEKNGRISASNIEIAYLSTEILDALTPLLLFIEENNLILDFNKFCTYCDRFTKSFTVAEKHAISGPRRTIIEKIDKNNNNQTIENKECTFKPQITQHSRVLAEKKRQFGDLNYLTQFLYEDKHIKDEKKRKQQREKEINEFKSYSFQPEIHEFNQKIFKKY